MTALCPSGENPLGILSRFSHLKDYSRPAGQRYGAPRILGFSERDVQGTIPDLVPSESVTLFGAQPTVEQDGGDIP
jgi:hypothetical protein